MRKTVSAIVATLGAIGIIAASWGFFALISAVLSMRMSEREAEQIFESGMTTVIGGGVASALLLLCGVGFYVSAGNRVIPPADSARAPI